MTNTSADLAQGKARAPQVDATPLDLIDAVQTKRRSLLDEGRAEAVAKQHGRGKWTARQRIAYLTDPGSFHETGIFAEPMRDTDVNATVVAPADGVITGSATINGKPVMLGAMDFTILGGSVGEIGMRKLLRTVRRSGEAGIPLVLVQEGGGHRIQDGQDSRHFSQGYGIWDEMARMSGWVPIVSAMVGPCFAAATNFAAMADYVVMLRGIAQMGMAGPALVKAGTGEDVDVEQLGGADVQVTKHGIAHDYADTEEGVLDLVKRYLSFMPANAAELPPQIETHDPVDRSLGELLTLVPTNLRKPYDVRKVIQSIADVDSVMEIQPRYARNIVTSLGRLGGRAVGIVANQPMHLGGMLDTPSCEKAAHFIAVCDAYSIPLIFLVDVPGFSIGPQAEKTGLGRRSGRLLYELGSSTVPRLSVIMRKGYGAAFVAMNGGQPSFQAEACVAWPTAEICAMSVEGAVDVVYRRDYQSATDPAARRKELIDLFKSRLGAIRAAEHFHIDDVIDPRDTRKFLFDTLSRSRRRRDHGFQKYRTISPI